MVDLVVKSREEWRDYWLRCYSNRNPDADVGPGSYPWLRASVQAETLTILSADALAISDSIPLDNMTGSQLDAKYGDKLPRNLETNASGYVTVSTVVTGATITIGTLLVHPSTRNQYKVTSATGAHLNGTQIAVESVDPGTGQNLAPGEVLQWVSPPIGCYATVVVFTSPDGEGLIGGRGIESDDEYRERIRDFNANPIGHGNEGDVIALVEASREHGVPVEKCFVYPAAMGPGTLSYTFTVKRDNYWESRRPSSAQLTDVFAYVTGQLPGDFSITPAALYATDCVVDIGVTLDPRYGQWADFSPWPIYYARGAGQLVIGTVTSATTFQIVTDNAVYTSVTAPVAGNTIAVFDSALGVFRKKKILTVGGTGPWSIVCNTTADQSDVTYTPTAGQAVSPWFDAINSVAAEAGTHFAKMGPSENVATVSLPEDGTRMARQPRAYPDQWDNTLTTAIAYRIKSNVPQVASCSLLAASPTTPTLGTIAANYILSLADLSTYPTP